MTDKDPMVEGMRSINRAFNPPARRTFMDVLAIGCATVVIVAFTAALVIGVIWLAKHAL